MFNERKQNISHDQDIRILKYLFKNILDDYDKFLSCQNTEMPPSYVLQSYIIGCSGYLVYYMSAY